MSWGEREFAKVVAYGHEYEVELPATLGDVVSEYIRNSKDDVFLNGVAKTSRDSGTELQSGDVVEIRAAVVAKNGHE